MIQETESQKYKQKCILEQNNFDMKITYEKWSYDTFMFGRFHFQVLYDATKL
jgi:hypothetical protein